MSATLCLKPGKISLKELRHIHHSTVTLTLCEQTKTRLEQSAAVVRQVIKDERTVYGINTGFGLLANTRINSDELETLQRSIVLSHAAGTGEFMQDSTVRLMMALKINSLARGLSGVRVELVEALLALLNHEIYPLVPQKGSVGASGDLAPLAHMSCILLGEGKARRQGSIIDAKEALKLAKLTPLTLAPKEGLALLNGTQASTAFALEGLFHAEDLFAAATVIGSMSVEAALGSRVPFDERIHQARGQAGQIDSAAVFRHLLNDSSAIAKSHSDCEKVQDPYSLRCQPQVLGACLDQIRHAAHVIHIEANAVSDNPLVFSDTDDILSGGNFHAEPIAMVSDNLALAIAEIGALSERRMALLIDSHMSKLPPFLVDNGGVNSGFMIAQVTSAALASENKSLAHPACVDSLPTSANQEDHVSMATYAARRLYDMSDNTRSILAIELLAAAQGLDFRSPLSSSVLVEKARKTIRDVVSFYDHDRYFSPDIEEAKKLLASGVYNKWMIKGILPSL